MGAKQPNPGKLSTQGASTREALTASFPKSLLRAQSIMEQSKSTTGLPDPPGTEAET